MIKQILDKVKYESMYYVALLFTIIPFIMTWQSPSFFWVASLTLLFDVAYIALIWTKNIYLEYLCWIYIGMYIVGMTRLNLNFGMFVFFQTNLLTFRFPHVSYKNPKWILFYLELVLLYAMVLQTSVERELVLLLLIMHLFAFGMMFTLKANIRKEELKEQLQERNASINLLLAENERNRIGRDLHDSLGHTFALLTLKTELAQRLLENKKEEQTKKELAEIHAISKQAMADVRRIIDNLKTRTLIEELATIRQMLELTGIKVEVIQQWNYASLSVGFQSSISMILLELATNVIKHAQATECRITLASEKETLIVEMLDNGSGFAHMNGDELHSIYKRAVSLNGDLVICSPRQPTVIRLYFPTN